MALGGSQGIVTGGSGFVGRHVLALLPSDCTVVATYARDEGFPAWAAGLAADVRPLRIDLRTERLASAVAGADWLLHLAAPTPSAGGGDDLEQAIATTAVNATADVAAKRVVHASSGSVYSGSAAPYGPGAPIAPVGAYGRGKARAEQAIDEVAAGAVLHARLFNPFGPGERPTRLIAALVAAAAAGDVDVTLRVPPEHRSQPLAVATAAAILAALVAAPATGAIDVAGRESLAAEALVRRIFAAVAPGVEPEVAFKPAGDGDWLRHVADPTAAEAAAGLAAPDLDAALRAYAELLRAQRA